MENPNLSGVPDEGSESSNLGAGAAEDDPSPDPDGWVDLTVGGYGGSDSTNTPSDEIPYGATWYDPGVRKGVRSQCDYWLLTPFRHPRVSFIDALRLLAARGLGLAGVDNLILNPRRPRRQQLRVVRRRKKQYDLLTCPRNEWKCRRKQWKTD